MPHLWTGLGLIMDYPLIRKLNSEMTCLECGKVFYGRPDKKFCCQQCKNRSNHRRGSLMYNRHFALMSALDANYKILEGLLASNATAISMDELKRLGFNTFVVTGHRRADHHEQYFCYDVSYFQTPGKIFGITRQHRELPLSENP